jgi:hypothetical protein
VWKLVPRPEDIKIFTSKWALARKRNEYNEIVRYKARRVVFDTLVIDKDRSILNIDKIDKYRISIDT